MNNELKHLYSVKSVFSVAFNKRESGSALVLAIVLTSMLAIIASLFLMTSRIQRMATASIAEDKDLDSAIESVVAQISQQLVLDVPNVPGIAGQEYYDYPDVNNPWLANLEPYAAGGNYFWRQISDVDGKGYLTNNVGAVIVPDTKPVVLDALGDPDDQLADADGDGVSDSKWIRIVNMTSGKGQPIYAAVRVIDNGAMLNVNTAYEFKHNPLDPTVKSSDINGSSQTHINLMALSGRDSTHTAIGEKQSRLDLYRCGYGREPNDISLYENNVIRYYNRVNGNYTPFDISDELKLRNRYFLNNNNITTRIEGLWTKAYDWWLGGIRTDTNSFTTDPDYWLCRVNNSSADPCVYDYRHISTTYNMDRIINPLGPKLANARMINVNAINTIADVNVLYSAINEGFFDAGVNNAQLAAQLAVNIKDHADIDADVTEFRPFGFGTTYYGFEQPCIFISELAYVFKWEDVNDQNDPDTFHRSYAIELRKRFPADTGDRFELEIDGFALSPFDLSETSSYPYLEGFDSDYRKYCVLVFEDTDIPLKNDVIFSDSPENSETGVSPKVILRWPRLWLDNGTDPNYSYKLYLSDTEQLVNEANELVLIDPNFYIPDGNSFLYNPEPDLEANNTTYYWRIDDIYDGNVVQSVIWNFTTWSKEPNVVILPELKPSDPDVFNAGTSIKLYRYTAVSDTRLLVDEVTVPDWLVPDPNTAAKSGKRNNRSYQRDMTPYRFIKRLWDPGPDSNSLTLGSRNTYEHTNDMDLIQVHFDFDKFTNVGEIGMVFKEYMYAYDGFDWGYFDGIEFNHDTLTENVVRLDLADPNFQPLFRYLTRFDPAADGIDNDGDGITDENIIANSTPEWKIPGRININTAPWYVIAQLPWVSDKLAHAIVAYRDKTKLFDNTGVAITDYTNRSAAAGILVPEAAGFASTGWLLNVINPADKNYNIRYYAIDNLDQVSYPDLRTDSRSRVDGAKDDFEERDLIFARISDLVTVRSDVFTAYILIRLGTDGPQKRAIAILDRSDVYPDGAGGTIGRVKIRALHLVPDPR